MTRQKLCMAALLLAAAVSTADCMARLAAAQSRAPSGVLGRLRGGGEKAGPLREHIGRRQTSGNGKGAERVEIAGLKVSVWRPASDSKGPAPLVIFSHGFHGSSTQSTFLMKALTAAGYLVVAPNHKDAMGGGSAAQPEVGFEKPGAWSDKTYKDRADDIASLIQAMKKDPAWAGAVDWSKVALAGHSLGGYTVLGLAGAWPSWKLPDVKAVLALSPYCAPYIQKGSLGDIKAPVMYQGGTRDFGITPSVIKSRGAFDQTSGTVAFVEFDKAGHFAWTDLNPQYQSSIDYYCIAFLDKYVKGDKSADFGRKRSDVTDLRSK